jgi:hypothetical protein
MGSLFQECELCRRNHRRPSTAPHVTAWLFRAVWVQKSHQEAEEIQIRA